MPWLAKDAYINFTGGEPLLNFSLLKETVHLTEEKRPELGGRFRYSLTTNGSLLTEDILKFLETHRFHVELSFDSLSQDITRKQGSFGSTLRNLHRILEKKHLTLEINTVFIPQTVGCLSDSLRLSIAAKIPHIRFSLSTISPWSEDSLLLLQNELKSLRRFLLGHYQKTGNIPVVNFRPPRKKGVFRCAAGKRRIAVAPDGNIWGCYLFHPYFRGKETTSDYPKYAFGPVDTFIKNHETDYPIIAKNYSLLSMDNFSVCKNDCFLCRFFESCAICPINAAFSGLPMGKIPDYACRIQKIMIRQKEAFMNSLE